MTDSSGVLDDITLVAITLSIASAVKKRKTGRIRKKWAKEWLLRRNELSHTSLIQELGGEPSDFFNYLRMDSETYEELLKLVTPLIQRQGTCMRKPISPHERLSATLRFLATGRSYEDLKYSTAISAQALGKLIPETCRAIYKTLREEYFKVRNTISLLRFTDRSNHFKTSCLPERQLRPNYYFCLVNTA